MPVQMNMPSLRPTLSETQPKPAPVSTRFAPYPALARHVRSTGAVSADPCRLLWRLRLTQLADDLFDVSTCAGHVVPRRQRTTMGAGGCTAVELTIPAKAMAESRLRFDFARGFAPRCFGSMTSGNLAVRTVLTGPMAAFEYPSENMAEPWWSVTGGAVAAGAMGVGRYRISRLESHSQRQRWSRCCPACDACGA